MIHGTCQWSNSSHFRPQVRWRRHRMSQNSRSAVHCLQDHDSTPIYMEPGSVTIDSTRDLQALYPNSFNCIGDMQGEYDIKVNPTVPPVQHGRQKVPIKYKEEIEKELAEMVHQRIITKQTEPTPWVSSLTYPKKANSKLIEYALTPRTLNKAIICENHKAPTLEESSPCSSWEPPSFQRLMATRPSLALHLTEGSVTPDDVQYTSRKVQILMCSLRTENVPRYLPNADGWHCSSMPRSIGHTWRCVHLQKGWQRPQCKHYQLVQRGPKGRTHV